MAKEKTRDYYYRLFRKYPDVVDLPGFCAMLGGISDIAARKLVRGKYVKSFFIAQRYGYRYMIPKEYVIDYVLSEHYADYKKNLKVQV